MVMLLEMRECYPDWPFTEIGTDRHHVRVHMVIPPKYGASVAVETIKKNTSRALRRKFQFMDTVYLKSRRHLINRILCVYGGDY